jgi:hypothetical protein
MYSESLSVSDTSAMHSITSWNRCRPNVDTSNTDDDEESEEELILLELLDDSSEESSEGNKQRVGSLPGPIC